MPITYYKLYLPYTITYNKLYFPYPQQCAKDHSRIYTRLMCHVSTLDQRPNVLVHYDVYMFQFEPVFKPGNEGVVHHILLYECFDEIPANWHSHGAECYTPNMPDILQRCKTIMMAWAVGGGVSHNGRMIIGGKVKFMTIGGKDIMV